MTGAEIGSLLLWLILGVVVVVVGGLLLYVEIVHRWRTRQYKLQKRKTSFKIKEEWRQKYG